MANRFWVGNGGNWSDALNHWSASSGGAPNASKPTSADNVYFDANSVSNPTQTVTVDESSACLDMDWTGATNTPTLALTGGVNLSYSGDVAFIAAMVASGTSSVTAVGTSGTQKLTTNGLTIACGLGKSGAGGTLQLADNLTSTSPIFLISGTMDTNNKTVTTTLFEFLFLSTGTLTLGSSVLNVSRWIYENGTLTLTPNTSTIKVSGTGVFTGGGIITYNNVELNGTAHTISGDNTFAKVKLAAGSTITITPASTQTIRRLTTLATASNPTTIQTGGAAATIQKHRGYCELNHVDLTAIVAAEKYRYYAGNDSTDGGGNTNWIFTHKVRPEVD